MSGEPFGRVGGPSAPNDSIGARPYKAIGTHPNFFGDRRLKSHAGHFRGIPPLRKERARMGYPPFDREWNFSKTAKPGTRATGRPGRPAFVVLLWGDLVNYAATNAAGCCRAVEVPGTVEHNAAVNLAPVSPAGEGIQQGEGPFVFRAGS